MITRYRRLASIGDGLKPRYLVSLVFPTTGVVAVAGTVDLGIAWANPADHTQALDAAKFPNAAGGGFEYHAVNNLNLLSVQYTSGLTFGGNINFYFVDQFGADIYSSGASLGFGVGLGFFRFNNGNLIGAQGVPVSCGIRGELTISAAGLYSFTVPNPWIFYGGPGTYF